MTEIKDLKDSILSQVEEENKQQLFTSLQKIESDLEAEKKKLITRKQDFLLQKSKELNQSYQAEYQQIINKKRQSTLLAKQTILKELFEDAFKKMCNWTVDEEKNFICEILKKYQGPYSVIFGEKTLHKLGKENIAELQNKFETLIFSKKILSNEYGLVISKDNIDDNYLYRDLINAIFKAESSQIANKIFAS
ncbi:hypothetical protein ETI37_04220 [Lactobacillus mulieris]|uniref:hypothetical protein n=1 Tax=Lactobacillus TaxID=1578 RepID=UPI001179FA2E|nr:MULTISPECIES: hypothetical protein [Lactobacillus]KAA9244012.1 hypothetical protein F6I33_05120 [Lactobacillus jensenii]MCW8124265.1 hypothetical protein [Lactobacillus mulieris]MCZ9599375.1 hypothetical protein [Lactobacillus mulieris]MDK7327480.1 hypothetical protein [Lactobacillus mulieris]TRT38379.1 hypothetical protein ETI26_03725 [Lactobacillus sp. c10Ua232AE]